MNNYIAKLALLVIVLLPFMPTSNSEANKLIVRDNCYNERSLDRSMAVVYLRSPMPWEKATKK